MENEIARAKHDMSKQDMLEAYDILRKSTVNRPLIILIDTASITLCLFYTSLSSLYLFGPHAYSITDITILVLMILLVILTIWRFLRKLIIRNRYAEALYKQLGNPGEDDYAVYYSDKVVVNRSKSRYELFYSDSDKLLEGENMFIIMPRSGASHIGKKSCFTEGSFDDVRRAFYSRR